MGRVDLREVFVAFNGEISNEDELLQSGISTGKHTLTQYIYLFRLIRSYWFQDYNEAARLTDLYGSHLMRFLIFIIHSTEALLLCVWLKEETTTKRSGLG